MRELYHFQQAFSRAEVKTLRWHFSEKPELSLLFLLLKDIFLSQAVTHPAIIIIHNLCSELSVCWEEWVRELVFWPVQLILPSLMCHPALSLWENWAHCSPRCKETNHSNIRFLPLPLFSLLTLACSPLCSHLQPHYGFTSFLVFASVPLCFSWTRQRIWAVICDFTICPVFRFSLSSQPAFFFFLSFAVRMTGSCSKLNAQPSDSHRSISR